MVPCFILWVVGRNIHDALFYTTGSSRDTHDSMFYTVGSR